MRIISVLDILDSAVLRYGDKVAVTDENESFTYRQLQDQAKILGYALNRELQGERQKPVVLFMEKSCKCISAMHGVLYSGNIYVPMDVKTPVERLQSILQTLGSGQILSSARDMEILDKIGYRGTVLVYEELIEKYKEQVRPEVLEQLRDRVLDTDLMYILFTSGSTGAPKGVAVMHRAVIDYIDAYTREVPLTENDILGNQAPFYADMSLKDIYMPIAAGAAVCIIPQKYFMSPKKLMQYLEKEKITFLPWVPTAYRIIAQFDVLDKIRPEALNTFLFSGETMPVSVYEYWRIHYPHANYIQLYGPTEITGACTFYNVTGAYQENETIPIGKPFRNTGILLLDEKGDEIKCSDAGITGEICVFGTCLAAGYYNDPEKTAEVFVENPIRKAYPNKMYRTGDLARWDGEGNLVFVSRKDYQIKHAGRRIELGEIEIAVQSVEEVKACCCVHDRKNDALVLYYIGGITAKDIMQKVQDKIPKYMIPAVYHRETELPMLPNGKLNRKLMDQWVNGK